MNKQQAQEQLNKLMIEVEKLKYIINSHDKSKEEQFFELIQCLTPKWDKANYPDSIFYFKGDKLMFEYNQKIEYVWVRHTDFWRIFEVEYKLNDEEIRDFLKDMLEEHFKWQRVTPHIRFKRWGFWLEEHFKK